MAEIKLSTFAELKLDELIDTLYEAEYFGFFESSLGYVQNLRAVIFSKIHSNTKKLVLKNMAISIVSTNTMIKQLGIFYLIKLMIITL